MSTDTTFSSAASEPRARGRLAALVKQRMCGALAAIEEGELVLEEHGERHVFGGRSPGPRGHAVVRDPRFWSALALRGVLGGAEAYIDGSWSSDDPVGIVRVLARNARALGGLEGGSGWLRPWLRLAHWLRDNDRAGSRRNISAHYDLGNEFFASFLDDTLTYSSAIFEHPEAPLEQAQRAKYERLCQKIALRPEHHVLEIGTGWGGFAIHAARSHGCRVTTTTISREQYALARDRVERAGVADRVRVLCQDYRDLTGTYDRLVSIEMIEAVGHRHLQRFFEVCSKRLAQEGVLALQAILVHEQDWELSKRSVDFVKRYIFPGGQLVSMGAIAAAVGSSTDLRFAHYEDITPHYAETLRRWRERFLANRSRARELGLSETFQRTWDFYLAYCEGAFRERANVTAQLVFEKPGARMASLLGELARSPLEIV